MADDRAQTLAVQALATAVLRDPWKAFLHDDRPDPDVEKIHAIVEVSRRFGGLARAGGAMRATGWRVTFKCVGRTVKESLAAMEDLSQLEGVRVVVDDGALVSTPLRFESSNPPRPDDGAFTGSLALTYLY